jgi:hypothetical protein
MFGINEINRIFRTKKIFRTRNHYWSSSRLADYIRGENKPLSLPFKDWNLWEEETKKKNRLRYYIAEELLDRLQDIISLPFDIIHAIKIYIRNRYIDKIHYLKTGLEPGTYYDLDHRILHGLFNELVDFVEIEHAQRYRHSYTAKYKYERCAEAGVDNLKWSANRRDSDNSPTSQAIFSMKTLNLYFWWKNRPNRACPYDLYSRDKAYSRDKDGSDYHKNILELETIYEEEDTRMLIELINIRGSLWT